MHYVVLLMLAGLQASWPGNAMVSAADRVTPKELHMEHNTTSQRSKEELRQIYQAVLDLEALQKYFHAADAPDRKPLLLLSNATTEGRPELTKFGMPVQYVSKQEAANRPYVELTKSTIGDAEATVEFRYPVEGIRGNVTLKKHNQKWDVVDYALRER